MPTFKFSPTPTPPTTVNAPVVVLVDVAVPLIRIREARMSLASPVKTKFPPNTKSLAIPTPPSTTRAPVVVEVEFVVVVKCTKPLARKLLTTNSSAKPLNINCPPSTKSPAIPTPPSTTSAPVVVLVDVVVAVARI